MNHKNTTTLGRACLLTGKLATPLVISRLASSMNMFVAMLLIAHLGHSEMAAGALVTSLSGMLLVIVWSILFSVGVVAGRAYGAGEKELLGVILRSGWLLGTFASIPIILVMLNIAPILRFFGQNEHLVNLTQNYFYGLAWSVLPSVWTIACSQFVISVGRPKVILLWSFLQMALMLIPGYALLFGKWGLPKVGMAGMAYANAFMAWGIFVIAIIYLMFKQFKDYRIFTRVRFFDFGYLKKLFTIGYPISIQFGAELAAFSLTTIFYGWVSQASLAAWQVVIQLNMIIIMIPYGIAQASSILVGQHLGMGNGGATRVLGNAGVLLGFVFMLIAAIFYLFAPKILVSMYLNVNDLSNIKIIHIAVVLLAVGAFAQIFDGVRNIVTGALRGFHDTKIPMFLGILATWIVGLPLSYFMGFTLHWGPVGISMGFLLGVLVFSVIIYKRFYKLSFVTT